VFDYQIVVVVQFSVWDTNFLLLAQTKGAEGAHQEQGAYFSSRISARTNGQGAQLCPHLYIFYGLGENSTSKDANRAKSNKITNAHA